MDGKVIDKRWFQDRIRDAGISQADLARQLEIDRSALSLMLSGKRSMKLEEAAGIAGVLSLDVDDVLARAGVRLPSSATSVPIFAAVDARGCVHRKSIVGQVEFGNLAPEGAVAVRCEDLAAVFYGWVFLFVPRASVSPEGMQRVSIVQLEDDTEHLAAVNRGFDRGLYNLRGLDGRVQENQRLKSASPVLWIKSC